MSLNSPGYNQVRTLNNQMITLNHIEYTSIYYCLFHSNSIIGILFNINSHIYISIFLEFLRVIVMGSEKSTFQMTFRKVTSLCSRKYKNKSNYSALPLTIKIYSFFILCKRIKAVKSLFNDDSGIYEQTVLQMKFHLHFVWGYVISYLGIDDITQEVQEYAEIVKTIASNRSLYSLLSFTSKSVICLIRTFS